MIDDFERYDALGLADLVRRREVSAPEVLEATLERVARLNPTLNAVVTPLYDQARQAVADGLPEGPFTGVPYLFKELSASVLGSPTTSASRLYANAMPAADSEIVARCRRAGMVIIGRSNASEFGLAPVTEPALFGPTRNPWDLRLSPGGSSGGSAAAVAAGMLPMGHATDGAGSIRIPAACCGLFGLKPTRGRITSGPQVGEGLAGLSAQHAVTWSVRDSAALLDATAGPMTGDPYFAAPPRRPYLDEVQRDPGRLRIAFSTADRAGTVIDPECAAAVRQAAQLCEDLGHDVSEDAPIFDDAALRRAYSAVFEANTMAGIARATGGALPADGMVEPMTRAIAERGRTIPAAEYIGHLQLMQREARRLAAFFSGHDIWLSPVLATLPPKLGWFDTGTLDADAWARALLGFVPFAWLANVGGQPAMSVPLGQSKGGLPIGCHFMAGYGAEDRLFQLAGQLERAAPWAARRPPVNAASPAG